MDSEKLMLVTPSRSGSSSWTDPLREPSVMPDESDNKELKDHEVGMARLSTGSEVVVLGDHIREAVTSAPLPTIANVTQSSRVHIGPKVEIINVRHQEVVKGRILGLELISPQNTNRLRCSIAVFVCWALVVVCALIYIIFYFALAKNQRLDLDLNETWYLRRGDWLALPEYKLEFLELPVSYVIIGHSAMAQCTEKYQCIKDVQEIQKDHLRRSWNDIGPNFLVGGDSNGSVFEGRGANILGAMVLSWNRIAISFMFLGDYRFAQTSKAQYNHIQMVIDELVKQKVLKSDYIVYGQCQVKGDLITPGPNIIDTLGNLTNWNPVNVTGCIRS